MSLLLLLEESAKLSNKSGQRLYRLGLFAYYLIIVAELSIYIGDRIGFRYSGQPITPENIARFFTSYQIIIATIIFFTTIVASRYGFSLLTWIGGILPFFFIKDKHDVAKAFLKYYGVVKENGSQGHNFHKRRMFEVMWFKSNENLKRQNIIMTVLATSTIMYSCTIHGRTYFPKGWDRINYILLVICTIYWYFNVSTLKMVRLMKDEFTQRLKDAESIVEIPIAMPEPTDTEDVMLPE